MKQKLIIAAALFIVTLLGTSCYKTGEIIYQTGCKPTELDYSTNQLLQTPGMMFTAENEFQSYIASPHMSFTYFGNNRRLNGADEITSEGTPAKHYSFGYDANNNLTGITLSQTGATQFVNYVFSYPVGTASSIATEFNVAKNLYPPPTPGQVLTFKFNDEFQLTAVLNLNGDTIKKLEYNTEGNCTKVTNFRYTGFTRSIISTYEFLAYDNKVNPARTDRYLQLFLHSYSKNNPTLVKRTLYPDISNPFPGEETATASYELYDPHDLPRIRNGFFFGAYDCIN
jgi:YD repeat-containing protein